MTPLTKRLTIALVISVALNLLFIGLVAGRGFRRHRGAERFGDARELEHTGKMLMRHHPALRAVFEKHRDDFAARRRAVASARIAVAEAVRHDPFDPAAVETAFTALRQETASSQKLIHDAVLEACKQAPPDARRALADGFLKHERGF